MQCMFLLMPHLVIYKDYLSIVIDILASRLRDSREMSKKEYLSNICQVQGVFEKKSSFLLFLPLLSSFLILYTPKGSQKSYKEL